MSHAVVAGLFSSSESSSGAIQRSVPPFVAAEVSFVAVAIEDTPKSVIRPRLSSEMRTFSCENTRNESMILWNVENTYCLEITMHNFRLVQIKEPIYNIRDLRDGWTAPRSRRLRWAEHTYKGQPRSCRMITQVITKISVLHPRRNKTNPGSRSTEKIHAIER